MSEKNSIEMKIQEIDQILAEIESGEVSLEDISVKYKSAIEKANQVEKDLSEIENEIEIISKDFSQN